MAKKPKFNMREPKFNRKLSRQIDATHIVLEALKALPANKRTQRKTANWIARLRTLEARIP